jgi:hypothetical protein
MKLMRATPRFELSAGFCCVGCGGSSLIGR